MGATPQYENDVQGTISASTNPLALAISGQGFFQVTQETSNATQATVLSTEPEYTRDGDFSLDKNGYLVNDVGQVLNGWNVDPATGAINQTQVAPITINQSAFAPVATQNVTLNANLPATPTTATATAASPLASQINVYDADGTIHTVSLDWVQNSANNWTVSIAAPDSTPATLGTANVEFGDASANNTPAGTIGTITGGTGTVTPTSNYGASSPATLGFTANFGNGPQPITLNLGTYGGASGVTQYAGNSYTLEGISQDGVAPGSFSGVSLQNGGDVVANYNNGQTRIVGQIPLTTFADADQLQKQNGQAYTPTVNSGVALAQAAGGGSAGSLVTSSLEGSNVDIATEFTKLIVAQQAYSANAKVVSTAKHPAANHAGHEAVGLGDRHGSERRPEHRHQRDRRCERPTGRHFAERRQRQHAGLCHGDGGTIRPHGGWHWRRRGDRPGGADHQSATASLRAEPERRRGRAAD